MSSLERNLGLEVVEHEGRPTLRVIVDWVRGYAASSGAAALSDPCTSLAAFEREAERLRGELDALVAEARARLGGAEAEVPKGAAPAKGVRRRPKLDEDLLVRDVMVEDVRVVGPNDPLAVADELMKQGRFRHALVVDGGELVGVLSQRDLFYGALAWSAGLGQRAHQRSLEVMPVKQVMNTRIVSVEPETPLAEAATKMAEHKIGCLPVLAGRELAGILTEGDFLALLASRPGDRDT